MRCPWYLFHRLFGVWARTQGPHDPLLPGGPVSCQSAPEGNLWGSMSYSGPHKGSTTRVQICCI
ncbi:unnamed protein product [Staurois parvus]|uniref:Secreted protein n=1 Tax=Staurois parvus TaxID=386267 RepID=A0ABN9DG18_9NEOB|nr:unnamed protein product [Staurois parvus]